MLRVSADRSQLWSLTCGLHCTLGPVAVIDSPESVFELGILEMHFNATHCVSMLFVIVSEPWPVFELPPTA
jgi:hypothetical protein